MKENGTSQGERNGKITEPTSTMAASNSTTSFTETVYVSKLKANPELRLPIHIVLSVLFISAIIVYTVLALTWYFTRVEVDQFEQRPATEVSPLLLEVSISCTNPPYCGNVTIRSNYTLFTTTNLVAAAPSSKSDSVFDPSPLGKSSQLGCGVPAFQETLVLAPFTANVGPQRVYLCAIPDQPINPTLTSTLPVAGLQVDFSSLNPGVDPATGLVNLSYLAYATVTVSSVVNDPAEPLTAPVVSFSRSVTMDSRQVKTLLLGQEMTLRDGQVTERRPTAVAIQYEGARAAAGPLLSWRTTLLIQQAPFINVYSKAKPGSLLEVLASIGGAIYVVGSVLTVVGGVFTKCCSVPSQDKSGGSSTETTCAEEMTPSKSA